VQATENAANLHRNVIMQSAKCS